MAQLRITHGYKRFSDANLLVKMGGILDGIKDNPYFVSPVPDMNTFETSINAFSDALANTGGKTNTANKNAKRKELIKLAVRLANYVLVAANENYEIAVTSRFDLAKAYGSAPLLTEPTQLKLQDGINAGDLMFSFKKVPGAKMYLCQYTTNPDNGVWTSVSGTTTKFFVKGLEHGKRYWFKVVAIGNNGQEVMSGVVNRVTQ